MTYGTVLVKNIAHYFFYYFCAQFDAEYCFTASSANLSSPPLPPLSLSLSHTMSYIPLNVVFVHLTIISLTFIILRVVIFIFCYAMSSACHLFYTVALVIIIIRPLFQRSSQTTFPFSLIFSDHLWNPVRTHPVLVSFLLYSINHPVTCGICNFSWFNICCGLVHDSLSYCKTD